MQPTGMSLVDDMLRLARLDEHPAGQHERVDLTALVTECTQRAQTADPQRTWDMHIVAGLVTTGDEELLRRAIDNLLANVHSHTPAGTIVTITTAGHDGTVTIEVSDNGPGVPAGRLPRIFDRFYRAAPEPPRIRPRAGHRHRHRQHPPRHHRGQAQRPPRPAHHPHPARMQPVRPPELAAASTTPSPVPL